MRFFPAKLDVGISKKRHKYTTVLQKYQINSLRFLKSAKLCCLSGGEVKTKSFSRYEEKL